MVAIIIGVVLQTAFDVRQITTSNEFINSFLHSEAVAPLVDQAKGYLAMGIIGLGFCLGLITFGIGVVLSRLRKLAARLEQHN